MPHPYFITAAERHMKYAAHLATMAPSAAIADWASKMTALYGPKCVMHNLGKSQVVIDGDVLDLSDYAVDWPTALLIGLHGEEPEASKTSDGTGWPSAFTELHERRAALWLYTNKWPLGAAALPRE
jgi:hypothetical protein